MKTNWLSLLQQANSSRGDKIPEGYKTLAEIAKEIKMNEDRTRDFTIRALSQGIIERKKVKLWNGRKLVPQYVYKKK